MKDNWISVDEKLPEDNIDVLCYFEGGDSLYDIANYDQEDDYWSLPNSAWSVADCAPTHWQPLPEPPK